MHRNIPVLPLANCFVFSPFCPLFPSDVTSGCFFLRGVWFDFDWLVGEFWG
ncbi:hypothetical protein ACE6H2_012508 [Prunus campanulata]